MNYSKLFFRTSLFVPISIGITLMLFMLFALFINYAEPGQWYYTSMYSKISLAILALVVLGVFGCQVKACWK